MAAQGACGLPEPKSKSNRMQRGGTGVDAEEGSERMARKKKVAAVPETEVSEEFSRFRSLTTSLLGITKDQVLDRESKRPKRARSTYDPVWERRFIRR